MTADYLVALVVAFLLVFGTGYAILAYIFRKEVLAVLKWAGSSVLSLLLVALTALFIFSALASVFLGLLLLTLMVLFILLGTAVSLVVTLASWFAGLVAWAITRKRDSFFTFHTLSKKLWRIVGYGFDGSEKFGSGLAEFFVQRLEEGLWAYKALGRFGKVALQPFGWLARKIWPRD